MTTIFELLKEDHRQVQAILEEIKETTDDAVSARREKFKRIREALDVHTQFEEGRFYPAARAATGMDEEIEGGLQEHDEARKMLEDIAGTDPGEADWMQMIVELGEALEHHIEDEEAQLFPAAREAMAETEAEALGEEYAQMKDRAMARAAE